MYNEKCLKLKVVHYYTTENEIDGSAFLELSEDDVRTLVPKLGVVKKICRLQKQLVGQFVSGLNFFFFLWGGGGGMIGQGIY